MRKRVDAVEIYDRHVPSSDPKRDDFYTLHVEWPQDCHWHLDTFRGNLRITIYHADRGSIRIGRGTA